MAWIMSWTFEGHVKPDLDKTVAFLRTKGATSFGLVGFCWYVGLR